MKKILEKINFESFMGIMFMIMSMVILLTNGLTYNLEYVLNNILGFMLLGFGTIRNDIKEFKQKLEGTINE